LDRRGNASRVGLKLGQLARVDCVADAERDHRCPPCVSNLTRWSQYRVATRASPRRTLRRGPNRLPLPRVALEPSVLFMGHADTLAEVAGLLADPARTRILTALLGGCAFTGKELAYFAGVTAPTASSHLSKLVAGELLTMEKQGRCHYYRLKSTDVARAIEGLMTVAAAPANGWPPGRR